MLCWLLVGLALAAASEPDGYPRLVRPRLIARRSPAGPAQLVSVGDWLLSTEPNPGLRLAEGLLEPELAGCETRLGRAASGGPGPDGRVALTRCADSFFAVIQTAGGRSLVLEPLEPRGQRHLLYVAGRAKRAAAAPGRLYNLSGDTFRPERYEQGARQPPPEEPAANELDQPGALEYFVDAAWPRDKLPTRKTISKSSPPRWLELAIVADYSVVEFHGSRVRQYLLALLNIVSVIYKDPSLESNMQLVVARMILYTDRKDGMVQQGNARRSLENVNKWNRKLLGLGNSSHDAAVWLTRLDIGGPSGYAPVSGACDPSRSCALNRDEGLTSAFIIAHELAHILGLSHDGDKNSGNTCSREAARGSIMAPMVAANFHNFHWSPCSRKEFHRKAKHWTCLLNRPIEEDSSIVRSSLNDIFSMDEQCRMEFGEGYGRCRSMEPSELCAHLWCGRANSSQPCKTKKGPPLEGTLCAQNKWCSSGSCESAEEKRRTRPSPLVVRGRPESTWGPWSHWTDCSSSCGLGVQYKTRRCNGASPSESCEGESREVRTCELAPCTHLVDRRAQQCSRFFGDSASNSSWLPFEAFEPSPNCRLVCYKQDTSEIFHTGLDLRDGTPCSYGTTDICVDGKCRATGCDGALGSSKTRDACGTCGGNNSTCETITAKFQRKLRRETTRLAVIPKSAYNMKIVVTILLMDSVPHEGNVKIVVRDSEKRRHEISEFDVDGRAPVMIIEAAAFRIVRLEEKYVLWSRGPLASEVVVLMRASADVVRSGASISTWWGCSVARSELVRRGFHKWTLGPPGLCSASCGGGMARRSLVCRDENGRVVARRHCLLVPKPASYRRLESCNTHRCEYRWVSGPWERCSCVGVQRRHLYCVRANFALRSARDQQLRLFRNTLPPSKCRGLPQPSTSRDCDVPAHCDP